MSFNPDINDQANINALPSYLAYELIQLRPLIDIFRVDCYRGSRFHAGKSLFITQTELLKLR